MTTTIHAAMARARDALRTDLDATISTQAAAMRGTAETARALNARGASMRAESERRRAAGVAVASSGSSFDARHAALLQDTVAYHDANTRHLNNYAAGLVEIAKRALLAIDAACKAIEAFESERAEREAAATPPADPNAEWRARNAAAAAARDADRAKHPAYHEALDKCLQDPAWCDKVLNDRKAAEAAGIPWFHPLAHLRAD